MLLIALIKTVGESEVKIQNQMKSFWYENFPSNQVGLKKLEKSQATLLIARRSNLSWPTVLWNNSFAKKRGCRSKLDLLAED